MCINIIFFKKKQHNGTRSNMIWKFISVFLVSVITLFIFPSSGKKDYREKSVLESFKEVSRSLFLTCCWSLPGRGGTSCLKAIQRDLLPNIAIGASSMECLRWAGGYLLNVGWRKGTCGVTRSMITPREIQVWLIKAKHGISWSWAMKMIRLNDKTEPN